MKIGIISALNLEIELVKKKLKIKNMYIIAGFKFYEGNYCDLNIILTICDVGKVNSASCTQILIDKFEITHIINLGVAGSLREDVRIYDLVISDSLIHHDVRKTQMANRFPYQPSFKASEFLKTMAIKSAKNTNKKYHIGKIVTGESFITDIKSKKKIVKDFSPHCVEMEGASIAHVAYINKIDFLVIRSISDNATEGTSLNDNIIEIASRNSGDLVLEILKNINKSYSNVRKINQ